MTHIGVYDAKASMSKLIERALAGEKITITVHGKPTVELVPVTTETEAERRRAAATDLLEFSHRAQRRYGKAVSAKQLKAWMEEGRK